LRFYEEKFRGKLFLQITGDGAVGLELRGWRTVLPTVETQLQSRRELSGRVKYSGVLRRQLGDGWEGDLASVCHVVGDRIEASPYVHARKLRGVQEPPVARTEYREIEPDARWRVHVLRNNDEYNEARNGEKARGAASRVVWGRQY
jgi:hypothetical protein